MVVVAIFVGDPPHAHTPPHPTWALITCSESIETDLPITPKIKRLLGKTVLPKLERLVLGGGPARYAGMPERRVRLPLQTLAVFG